MRLTRHNGRAGKFGTYNPKHNDRQFNVEHSEHIDPTRTKFNIYFDCYTGYRGNGFPDRDPESIISFEEIERMYYAENFGDFLEGQNRRNEAHGHANRNRTVEDLLVNKTTCPEETVYQIGTIDEHVSDEVLFNIVTDFLAEFTRRFGSHVHILDFALHCDEGTPHIQERHVFDALNQYGELCPQQEKALEELGFELPHPDKPKSKYNRRKNVFDAACREMLFDITERYGLHLDREPSYGGRAYLEKQDYILMKQKEKLAVQEKQIEQRESELEELSIRIDDVETLIDEVAVQSEILEYVRPYVKSNVAKNVEKYLNALKLAAYCPELPIQEDRIHFQNGTYFIEDRRFTPEKEFCLNRLPVRFNLEAPEPMRWKKFLDELLYPEDIPTLQEFMGYTLLPSNKGQKMMIIIGNGGEGKSRIGRVLRAILGDNMNTTSIDKLSKDKFCRADQEGKLLMLDDDMKLQALDDTNILKAIITMEDKMDLERKNMQSYQGFLYVRLLGLGNGSLSALYDRSDGFYRRQIVLNVREKDAGRVDDRRLGEKLRAEAEGILLWELEGLHRLLANDYAFTTSDRAAGNIEAAKKEDNNILDFLASEGYVRFEQNTHATSRQLYTAYRRWCDDNVEKPFAEKTFTGYLRKNEERLKLKYTQNIPTGGGKTARGYVGIHVQINTDASGQYHF